MPYIITLPAEEAKNMKSSLTLHLVSFDPIC